MLCAFTVNETENNIMWPVGHVRLCFFSIGTPGQWCKAWIMWERNSMLISLETGFLKQWKFYLQQPTKFYSYGCCKILLLLTVIELTFFACHLPLSAYRLQESFWSKYKLLSDLWNSVKNIQCCCMSQMYFWDFPIPKSPKSLYTPDWHPTPSGLVSL